MGLGAKLENAATAGLTGAVTGGIGSIISGGLGLLGGLFKKNNNGRLIVTGKLMQQAWEYEKEGMGLQYNYGQQAADAEYRRNLQMWKDTNFGAQRDEMEKAGLSVDYRDWETDRKSTRLNSSHRSLSRMPSSA